MYIDFKCEGLRDVLRPVLKDIQWISLGGDKPAVSTSAYGLSRTLMVDKFLGRAKPTVPLPF